MKALIGFPSGSPIRQSPHPPMTTGSDGEGETKPLSTDPLGSCGHRLPHNAQAYFRLSALIGINNQNKVILQRWQPQTRRIDISWVMVGGEYPQVSTLARVSKIFFGALQSTPYAMSNRPIGTKPPCELTRQCALRAAHELALYEALHDVGECEVLYNIRQVYKQKGNHPCF